MKSLLIYLFINLLMILFLGCEKDPEPAPPEPQSIPEPECVRASDCGAGYPDCYAWTCAEGECVYELDDSKCSEGYFCKALAGCTPEYNEPEPGCETNEDCFSFGCIVSECRSGRCFAELHDELCLPYQKCDAMLGCIRDENYSPSGECRSDADCADRVDCTRDVCVLATRRCSRIPMNSACPRDYVCDTIRGCVDSLGY